MPGQSRYVPYHYLATATHGVLTQCGVMLLSRVWGGLIINTSILMSRMRLHEVLKKNGCHKIDNLGGTSNRADVYLIHVCLIPPLSLFFPHYLPCIEMA